MVLLCLSDVNLALRNNANLVLPHANHITSTVSRFSFVALLFLKLSYDSIQ